MTVLNRPPFLIVFLAGSAPRLRKLSLCWIQFRAMKKLLLSASHLVTLRLVGIPDSGYMSPETMVSCLSAMSRLGYLVLEFESPRSHPNQCPLTDTRSALPALTFLRFRGASTYLEVLVAQIDTPLLQALHISFSPGLISRSTTSPIHQPCKRAP
jgi:hypothetical protein